MAKTVKPTVETGAMTLVLLVKYYKSQMIALLLKNGVTVPSGASDPQIAMLMANLLKVSKSFFSDLNAFIQNPKVIQTLAGGMMQNAQYFRMSGNAQYFRMSGKGYMNSTGGMFDTQDFPDDLGFQSQYGLNLGTSSSTSSSTTTPATTTETTPPKKGGFWSDLNFGNIFSQTLGAFGQWNTNQANVAIANAHAQSQQVGSNVGSGGNTGGNTGGGTGGNTGGTPDKGMSTTTIVVLSLVGVAVLGTIIYFVAKPKQ
jgi:hypothetical protein